MRKFSCIACLLIVFLKVQAQDYSISFTCSGDTNVLSRVRVDNLTNGNSVSLNSGDILHLKSSLGIDYTEFEKNQPQLCPNPMYDQSALTFFTTEESNTIIRIVDVSGKTVIQTQAKLSAGKHSFLVSGIRAGIYFVVITANNFHQSIKLNSQCNGISFPEIKLTSTDGFSGFNPYKSVASTIDLRFSEGDLLLFEGTAGPYKAILTDSPDKSKTLTFNFVSCHDYDGNNYGTIELGTQTWMAENLKTTHFPDGSEIPLMENNLDWGNLTYTSKAYCYYDNSISNGLIFGALYTWTAAMNGAASSELNPSGVQGICPCGWHLPSDDEWMEFEMFLGMTYEEAYGLGWRGTNEGDKLKTSSGWYNDGNGTNSSGFSALPAGTRVNSLFTDLNKKTCYWSTTEYMNNHTLAFNRSLSYMYSQIGWFSAAHLYGYPKNNGFSVRCLKN